MMYGSTSIKGLSKCRGRIYWLATLMLAALTMLMPAQARAQGAGKVSMQDFHFVMRHNLGMMPDQTLRVTVSNNSRIQDGSRTIKARIKLYDSLGNLLLQTNDVEIAAGQFRSFDFRPGAVPGLDLNGIYIFQGAQGRSQISFDVGFTGGVFVGAELTDGHTVQAAFELMDDQSSKTVLFGQVLPPIEKVRVD